MSQGFEQFYEILTTLNLIVQIIDQKMRFFWAKFLAMLTQHI